MTVRTMLACWFVAGFCFSPTTPCVAQLGPGDFNNDNSYDCADIDPLTATIAAGTNDPTYDLNGDTFVDLDDRDEWLAEAGNHNVGGSYLLGDANLTGDVDGSDYGVWITYKFGPSAMWCQADFNADGFTDVGDLLDWINNRFQPPGLPNPTTRATSGVSGDGIPDVFYDAATGLLSLDTDGTDFLILLVSGTDFTGDCILCNGDFLPTATGLAFFEVAFYNNATYWFASAPGDGPIGQFDLAQLAPGTISFPPDFEGFSVRYFSDNFFQFYTDVTVLSSVPTHTWTGAAPGDNNWSNSGNWTGGVPAAATAEVFIPDGTPRAELDVVASIGILDVDATGSITFNAATSLTINGGSLVNDGAISLGFTSGDSSSLFFDTANASISGSGSIDISGDSPNDNIDTLGGVTLTNDTGHSIRGSGYIQAALTNVGTIDADNTALALVLNDKDKTNSGLMKATGGGILQVSGITLANSGGTMEADGGTVVVQDGANIVGGTLTGNDLDFGTATLTDVEFAGTESEVLTSETLTLAGTNISHQGTLDASGTVVTTNGLNLTNNGQMTAVSGGMLQFNGNTVVNGSGLLFANGGNIELSQGTEIIGGVVQSDAAVIDSRTAKLTDVSVATGSQVHLTSGHVLTIGGAGITNNGAIQLGLTTPENGIVAFDTTGTWSGSGTLDMTGDSDNVALEVTSGNTMTNGLVHTIRGSGYLFGNMMNDGTVTADNSGATLFLDPDGSVLGSPDPSAVFENAGTGTLRATGGATLRLLGNGSGQFINIGTIAALDGSAVISDGAVIQQIDTSTGEVTGGTYRAIDTGAGATLDVAPSGFQVAINNGVIETFGADANNDVLGIKLGSNHFNPALMQNNGAIILGGGANLVVTETAPAVLSTSDSQVLVGRDSTLDLSARETVFPVAGGTTAAGLHIDGGVLRGSGTIDGGVYMPAGTLMPGDADRQTGLLSIVGDFNMDDPNLLIEDATTIIELGGYLRGDEYDSFDATGDFFGQGILTAELINGFLPNMNDEFVIATYVENGTVTGNLWDNYVFRRVQFSLMDRLVSGMAYETVLTVLDVRDIDFNDDDMIDCTDINALVAEIVSGANTPRFDLNFDNLVDHTDLDIWLADAGGVNLASGQPYLKGDANLDGVVDGTDYNEWNANKFTVKAEWCAGDFSANGLIDGSDFGIWNSNKFKSSGISTAFVPEPSVCPLLWLAWGGSCILRGRFAAGRRGGASA